MPTLLKSSNELLGRFLNFEAPDNYELISTDIKDMYSSINPKRALECLIGFINKNKLTFDIPLNKLENLLSTCILKCSSFNVDNKYYKQISGLKTGSPLSGLLADVYIYVNYESKFIINNSRIKKYCRFRDDTIMLCRSNYIETFLKTLNNADEKITFTIEKCSNGSIAFLDKELKLTNKKLHSKWYSKPIKGDKTMNFNAKVPFKWKKSNIIGFINRIIFSSYDNQTNDLDLVRMKRILIKNNYPNKLINDLMSPHY